MAEAGEHVDLAPLTSLRLGGPAERLVKVTDTAELIRLVQAADAEREPVFFLAGGSNVVIADEGVPGTTIWIRTTGIEERELEDGRLSLTVAAGEPWDDLVSRSVDSGLAGIECLSGIPGSVGATPVQNVGAYGQEVSSTIASVLVLDRESGQVGPMEASQCGFGYRSSRFKGDSRFLVLAVEFILDPSDESAPVAYAQLADALEVETGERVPLSVARETVLDLRRSKSMVLDPDDPDSVSAGSFFTNLLAAINSTDHMTCELRTDWRMNPAFPTIFRMDWVGAGNNGHFAVAMDLVRHPQVQRRLFVVFDPWYGLQYLAPEASKYLTHTGALGVIDQSGIVVSRDSGTSSGTHT